GHRALVTRDLLRMYATERGALMATEWIKGVATFVAAVFTMTACTTFDDLAADEGANRVAAACGDACPPGLSGAAPGAACKGPTDCASRVCAPDGQCSAATGSDGVKNGSETDIDCGGGAPTNASKCAAGKACREAGDCVWGFCTANVCEGHVAGRKDGD